MVTYGLLFTTARECRTVHRVCLCSLVAASPSNHAVHPPLFPRLEPFRRSELCGTSFLHAPLLWQVPIPCAYPLLLSPAPLLTPAPSQAANTLFFNTPGGTTQTLQGWYEGCSMGRTLLTSSTSKVVSVTLPCSGTTSTGTSWTSTTCDTYAFSKAADDAVTANGLATLANYP
jgi:hypothetical protein